VNFRKARAHGQHQRAAGASGITYQVTWRDGQSKQCARTTGSKPTVAGYAERFLATWRLSDSGRACYRLIIRKYLVPRFPSAMMDVTTADLHDQVTRQAVQLDYDQPVSGAVPQRSHGLRKRPAGIQGVAAAYALVAVPADDDVAAAVGPRVELALLLGYGVFLVSLGR
jgi:hypothetical protein